MVSKSTFMSILRGIREQAYYVRDQLKYPPRLGLIRVGTAYGGAYVVPDLFGPNSVVWSIGIGCDVSLDLQLIEKFGCKVYGFDPTPKSIKWIEDQELPRNFIFCPWGIAAVSGKQSFYLPANPDYVSGTVTKNLGGEEITCDFKTLAESAELLGTPRIALLKIDIEGEEYQVLADFLRGEHLGPPQTDQIWVEFHPDNAPTSSLSIDEILGMFAKKRFSIAKKHYTGYLLIRNG
jgi:FkbM family methyltransferase